MSDAPFLRSRRLPFWAIIIALVVCALAGVFTLLWFKLPSWAPEWVVEHSPWADPIVRAVEASSSNEVRESAIRRLAGIGPSVVPRMLMVMESDDLDVELVAGVFDQLADERAIQPMFGRLLMLEQTTPGMYSSAPPANDRWVSPLRHQRASSVTDALLPHLRLGVEIPYQVLDVAGGIDDHRLVEVLRQLMHQSWPTENFQNGKMAHLPTVRAAKALAESPCGSAISVLEESFGSADRTVRRRLLCGILLTANEGGRFEKSDWGSRIRRLVLAGIVDADTDVRQVAAVCMGVKEFPQSEELLLSLSYADEPGERTAAVFGLGRGKPSPRAQERIISLLRDPEWKVCLQAVYATNRLEDPALATDALLDLLASPSERLRKVVCSRLSNKIHRKDPRVFPAVLKAMGDPSKEVARRAEQSAWDLANTEEQKAAVEAASAELKQRFMVSGGP